jgi:hypothetical protein
MSVSVVIGASVPTPALASCLAALEPQRDGAEVLVMEGRPGPDELRRRFPWASFISQPGRLVPELWRDGIQRSSGDIVALTIGCMEPAPDWIETIKAQHRDCDVVAGAIEPGRYLRLRDWAEYFCRYARDMLPFPEHRCLDLPGDNASYKREVLERTRDLYRDGFWEPVVHRWLADDGQTLRHSPSLVVRQGRSAGLRAFVHQRWRHGRVHGRQRGADFTSVRNLLGVPASPVVAGLLTARAMGEAWRRRRLRVRFVCALPLLVLFNAAWAAGEARGHLDALLGA